MLPQKRPRELESEDDLADVEPNMDKNFGNNSSKWTRLEHRGVQFAPAYKPHNVKILYKGKKFTLCVETEEVCNFWA